MKLCLCDAFCINLRENCDIWNHEASIDIFSATMPCNRFEFIRRFITFDDKSTWDECKKNDKYACIHELFETINENNAKYRYPSSMLSIDETLYLYRGRIGFKQYNLKKVCKVG